MTYFFNSDPPQYHFPARSDFGFHPPIGDLNIPYTMLDDFLFEIKAHKKNLEYENDNVHREHLE